MADAIAAAVFGRYYTHKFLVSCGQAAHWYVLDVALCEPFCTEMLFRACAFYYFGSAAFWSIWLNSISWLTARFENVFRNLGMFYPRSPSRYSSTIRLTRSDTVIPSRFASFLRNWSCGSVKTTDWRVLMGTSLAPLSEAVNAY
jgi:hypothetical protein